MGVNLKNSNPSKYYTGSSSIRLGFVQSFENWKGTLSIKWSNTLNKDGGNALFTKLH